MIKNKTGQSVAFQGISKTNGDDKTSGSPTIYITIDDGTQTTGSGDLAHKGSGQWVYAPTQGETNGDHIAFTFSLTGAVSQTINTYPINLVDVSTLTVTGAQNLTYNDGITFSVAQDTGATGWPKTLRKGVGFTTANGTAFKMTPQDKDGSAIDGMGTLDFSASAPLFHFDKLKNQDHIKNFAGSASWVAASGPTDGYFLVTVSVAETNNATPYEKYMANLILFDGTANQTTIFSELISISPDINAS